MNSNAHILIKLSLDNQSQYLSEENIKWLTTHGMPRASLDFIFFTELEKPLLCLSQTLQRQTQIVEFDNFVVVGHTIANEYICVEVGNNRVCIYSSLQGEFTKMNS